VDGYWVRQAHAWDVAAGALLVREAVGRVTGGAGQPFDVDEATIVASNGRIHDRMVAILNGQRPPASRRR
jgi:myo-inositol-1(or 4)-monophosphatase